MKNAIEAKITGCRMLIRLKNRELVRLFRWNNHPTQNRRALTEWKPPAATRSGRRGW
jgi:hypothetical protein